MGSTRHLNGRDPVIAMLQVEGAPGESQSQCVFPRCLHVTACCSVKLTGFDGQSRNPLRTKRTAGPPAIIREHTDARTSACRLKQVIISSIVESAPAWGRCFAPWLVGSAHCDGGGCGRCVRFESRQQHNNTVRRRYSTPHRKEHYVG